MGMFFPPVSFSLIIILEMNSSGQASIDFDDDIFDHVQSDELLTIFIGYHYNITSMCICMPNIKLLCCHHNIVFLLWFRRYHVTAVLQGRHF